MHKFDTPTPISAVLDIAAGRIQFIAADRADTTVEVLPMNAAKKGPFHPNLRLGDLAVVIYKGQKTAAICGDIGPLNKIGEGSICLHEQLRPAAPDRQFRALTAEGPASSRAVSGGG